MKLKGLVGLMALSAALYAPIAGAATKNIGSNMSTSFVFVDDQIDGNYFITSYMYGFPEMGGSNNWVQTLDTDSGGGAFYQYSLGYIATDTLGVYSGMFVDMWLENSPISYPLLGKPCSRSQSGCSSYVISGSVTDSQGYYGAPASQDDPNPVINGMLSNSFYQYLLQMGIGSTLSFIINECRTRANYDPSSGERCKDQSDDRTNWYASEATFTKSAHLRLINTNAVDEVFINSDGTPTPGEGNTNCRVQTVGNRSGLACKMVSYSLQANGENNDRIRFTPVLNNSSLSSAITEGDIQFSLDGNNWKIIGDTSSTNDALYNNHYYYDLNEMGSSSSIYLFFADNFFKRMVALGMSDIDSRNLLFFRLYNFSGSGMPGSKSAGAVYDFNTSNSLEIKPREFSINISSEDYSDAPSREGYVGRDEPSLDFNYIVTSSGKTAADEVLIKATGPTQQINGRAYCIFSADDSSIKVPFPATLSFTKQDGSINTYDVGCDGSWRDMTDALWLTSAWTDISGEPGVMDKATVKFSIPMNDDISQKTLDNNEWYGDVSASGEIHVQATWRDID
ncbi:TPA: hypothetical protein SLP42_003115 [Klebsiella aerogenes]|nr:hypothetical protein [Klebsiella aerogenes]